MGLLNYSTRIPAAQTAGEIQGILAKHGAKAVMIEYGVGGSAEAMSFQIKRGDNSLGFRLGSPSQLSNMWLAMPTIRCVLPRPGTAE
ncbi:unnamed protein product [marine sediment metagenome]|uniref:Uncharacterized protein n=1 Tax=marine sediment metagenome TaxID=412755 RepID=X1F5F2_9ZZZZ